MSYSSIPDLLEDVALVRVETMLLEVEAFADCAAAEHWVLNIA
jgi:hypothetical protein